MTIVVEAAILAFAGNCLRCGEDNLLDRKSFGIGDNQFEEERTAFCVRVNEGAEIRQIILIRGKMKDEIYAL